MTSSIRMEPLPKHRCFCGRGFFRHSDFTDHQPHCPGDKTLTNRVSDYPSSRQTRFDRRLNDDSIPSPYHGHWYTDTSPDEPDSDSNDHHTHHQQSRTTKTNSNGIFDHLFSRGTHFNRRTSNDPISSPYHGHWYTDTSPDEPDSDFDDHHTHHQQIHATINDSNSVSFGSYNSGVQVGINRGVMHYHNSSENYANTSVGQIFDGDITAGRDIHIDNTINKVYSLFQSTANAPKIINQVQNELGMLNSVLTLTGERFRECNATEDERKTLVAVLKSCDEASMELSQLKERFEHADEQSQANLERFGLGLEEVKTIRATLTMNTQILNALITEMSRSSQANVERLLRKYAGEFENGKRDISRYSQQSLTEDESEIWREVRKDLQSIGITAESFRKNHDFIASTLRDLLPEIGMATDKLVSTDNW